MKKIGIILIFMFFGLSLFSQTGQKVEMGFPVDMDCITQPCYRYRTDGKPGREIIIRLKGAKLFGKAQVEVSTKGIKEVIEISPIDTGYSVCSILLSSDIALDQEVPITLTLRKGNLKLKRRLIVPALRHWTVYIYPHSHVDIGYTNTQANVEILHKRNIDEGIKLAEATKDYPQGSRYRWNPEVTWPLERYWLTASPEQKELAKLSTGRLYPQSR